MTEEPDDPQLLEIAGLISDGAPVDWQALRRDVSPARARLLDELQLLESVARLGAEAPATWGPYAIVEEIGRGAFGTVYRAHDPELRRDLALKVLRPLQRGVPLDTDFALREARRLAKVNHDNVVRVYTVDVVGGEVGIAMELVEGATLDALVKQQGPFSESEAAVIGVALCRALAAVHATETLHGDVKAHNVMRATSGRIVLMDFGTSRDLRWAGDHQGGDAAGTPLYLAPEVFEGEPRSVESDIYSLGVLLFYLVSGTYPVDGSTRTEVGQGHAQTGRRRLLRDLRPDLDGAMIDVIERAAAPRAADRYRTAGAVESALRLVLVPSPGARATTVPVTGVLLGVGTAALVGLGVWQVWPDRAAAVRVSGVRPAAAAPEAPGSYHVDAGIYREEAGREVRLQAGARLNVGDRLSLHIDTSVPAFVYLVNEDERGDSYLLFPLPGAAVNPLPAGSHRLPGASDEPGLSWRVTSAGIREHFVVFVTPERSHTLERLFASLPAPTDEGALAVALPPAARDELRGVGGLSASATGPGTAAGISRAPAFSTPLAGPEVAQGLWVRQIAFDNPSPR